MGKPKTTHLWMQSQTHFVILISEKPQSLSGHFQCQMAETKQEKVEDFWKMFNLREEEEKEINSSHKGNYKKLPPLLASQVSPSTVLTICQETHFPSKWDDAEKWLTSSSFHNSPAHNNMKILSETSNKRKQFDISKEQMGGFSKKSRNIKERVSKVVQSFHGSTSLDHHNAVRAFNRVYCTTATDIVLKDEFIDNTEFTFSHFTHSEPIRGGDPFRNQGSEVVVDHRDAMTEATTTSRCQTSFKSSSPARHNKSEQCHFDRLKLEQRHNKMSATLTSANPNSAAICTLLDIIQTEKCHFDKLKLGTECDSITSNWGSREEQEEEIWESLRQDDNANQKNDMNYRAERWEEDKKAMCCLRYQREEAKIQAWVNLQSANAEAKSRKPEVKIEMMRSKLEKKLMKKMAVVHRKADEWRAVCKRLQHLEQIKKATGQSQKMMISNYDPQFSSHISCGCFPCNNNHH